MRLSGDVDGQYARFRRGYAAPALSWLLGSDAALTSPSGWLPADERPRFADELGSALRAAQPAGEFTEEVHLAVLVGRRP